MAKLLMIGVSTAQNTTNVLPAIQLKVDYFVAIETSAAHKRNWSSGMNTVLSRKGIKVLDPVILKPENDSRIDNIYNTLIQIIPDDVEVIWNLGGGQKAQQFAMWQAFSFRAEQGFSEVACYANPEKKLIELWEFNQNTSELEYFDEKTNSDLSAKEIFEIYGFQLEIKNDSLFYSPNKSQNLNNNLHELLNFPEFRKFFFKLPKTSFADESNQLTLSKDDFINLAKNINDDELKKIFKKEELKNAENGNCVNESIVPRLKKAIIDRIKAVFNRPPSNEKIKIYNTQLKEKLSEITGKSIDILEISYNFFNEIFPDFRRISFLFEEMLKEKIQKVLANNNNYIYEAYTNIILSKNGTVIAEYDILLVTEWGTIISIDAKTFDATKKDIDARILNLRAGAGRYIEFALCFPYFLSDIDTEWFPSEIKKLPLKLQKHHLRYFMMNGQKNISKSIVNDQEINIIPIDCFLDELNLLKK